MKKGFTLIEIIIVIGVLSILLPIFTNIFFNLSRLQVQLSILQELKEQGDFVQNQIMNTVRGSATSIDSTCAGFPSMPNTNQAQICFYDTGNTPFGFVVDSSSQIASYSASLAQSTMLVDLTQQQFPLRITNPSFSVIDAKTASFSFTIIYTPIANFLPPQSLNYRFYTHLRN